MRTDKQKIAELQSLCDQLTEALLFEVHTSLTYWRIVMDKTGVDLYDFDILNPSDEEEAEAKEVILDEYLIDIH